MKDFHFLILNLHYSCILHLFSQHLANIKGNIFISEVLSINPYVTVWDFIENFLEKWQPFFRK